MKIDLCRELQIKPGVTAVIGSGGKTTLLSRLCRQLQGTVIVCTSTHIFPAEGLPLYTGKLNGMPAEKLCLGTPAEKGKLTAPEQSFEELAKLADFVLVEADGAKHLPIKAHLDYEPVIPACCNNIVQIVGLSGLGRPIHLAAHRPERFAQLCGCAVTDILTPARVAHVLNTENLAHRYVLNQADDLEEQKWGYTLADLLHKPTTVLSLI